MQNSVEVANFASRSKFVVINALKLGQSGNIILKLIILEPAGRIVIFLFSDEISRGETGLGGGAETGTTGEFQFEKKRKISTFHCHVRL